MFHFFETCLVLWVVSNWSILCHHKFMRKSSSFLFLLRAIDFRIIFCRLIARYGQFLRSIMNTNFDPSWWYLFNFDTLAALFLKFFIFFHHFVQKFFISSILQKKIILCIDALKLCLIFFLRHRAIFGVICKILYTVFVWKFFTPENLFCVFCCANRFLWKVLYSKKNLFKFNFSLKRFFVCATGVKI